MKNINLMKMDCSGISSDLCIIGAKYGTDKSPYSNSVHRHAYTAIYDMVFSSLRYEPIRFAEIGIFGNSSIKMWREYFSRAHLFGFDVARQSILDARQHGLHDTHYDWLDAGDPKSIYESFSRAGGDFDIIIDDSSHFFDHQINIVSQAYRFIRPGGILVIEDIHRPWGVARYEEALQAYQRFFSGCTVIDADHKDSFSEGTEVPWFDNDRLIFMVRNRVVADPYIDDAAIPG